MGSHGEVLPASEPCAVGRGGSRPHELRSCDIWVCSRSDSKYDRPTREGGPDPAPEVAALERHAREVTIRTHGYDTYTHVLGDANLPDGANVNRELVKQGWWGCSRKYAPEDTA